MALQRENVFPERPGQPECQFYMKTGDCKFGAVCRFHHPRERVIPAPDCILSPIGLPLRQVSCDEMANFCVLIFPKRRVNHASITYCASEEIKLLGSCRFGSGVYDGCLGAALVHYMAD